MSEDYYFSEFDSKLSNLFYDEEGLFFIGDVPFPSVEHAYQYFRFLPRNADTRHKEFVLELFKIKDPLKVREYAVNALKPSFNVTLNGDERITQLANWEEIRDDVMLQCLRAKFIQDAECKKELLDTGNDRLHLITHAVEEDETEEFYWGAGTHSFGKDRLGSTLMLVREELKLNSFFP